ncbi:MAG TPA: hypothetical protein VFM77_11370 [Terriglobales bacterium]|nr:hypothetical protein [Terriglobales bacterium]
MKHINQTGSIIVAVLLAFGSAVAQKSAPGGNAALRYWAAFSQIQDSGMSDQDAKELNAALETMGPFDMSKYKDLVQKNTLALQVMARGTSLPTCDWGLDYGLGDDVPVDYARKALVLGRLNILYVMSLYHSGNKDGAVRSLAAGLRFSHDVAKGGSLFATLVAKDLLVTHLIATTDGLRMGQLSAAQRSELQNAIAALGDGLDWSSAAKRDLEALRTHYAADPTTSAALDRIVGSYSAFLKDQSKLPMLTDAISSAQPELANLIPNPTRVLEQKQDLADKLSQARALLQ